MTNVGTQMAVDPKAAILEALTQGEYFPMELLQFLAIEKNLSGSRVKEAILDLIAEMKVEFSPDEKLRRSHDPAEQVQR